MENSFRKWKTAFFLIKNEFWRRKTTFKGNYNPEYSGIRKITHKRDKNPARHTLPLRARSTILSLRIINFKFHKHEKSNQSVWTE